MITRYSVRLKEGGHLLVIQQNLEKPIEGSESRGTSVRLAWRPEQAFVIPKESGGVNR